MDKIEEILAHVEELQSMPTIFLEALESINDPQVNAIKLSTIVSKDMALTTKLLRFVNSAFYGFQKEITQVNNAIAMLGFQMVKDIILMMAMKPMMTSKGGKDLWEHSIRCAYTSQMLAESILDTPAEEVFTIGLLHDIGRAIIQIYSPEDFDEIERLRKMGVDKLLVEDDLIGVTHLELGEAFAQKENLPEVISASIRHHHDPFIKGAPSMARIIYLAEMLIQKDIKKEPLTEEVIEKLGIEIEDVDALRKEIFEKTDAVLGILG